jgi:hypothetical protein
MVHFQVLRPSNRFIFLHQLIEFPHAVSANAPTWHISHSIPTANSRFSGKAGPRLSVVGESAFFLCSALESLWIPTSLCEMSYLAVESFEIRIGAIDRANRFFRLRHGFLVNFRETSLVKYLADDSEVALWRDMPSIRAGCFDGCQSLQ